MFSVTNKKELLQILDYEHSLYYNGISKRQEFEEHIKAYPRALIWKYVKLLRYAGYYYNKSHNNKIYAILYIIFVRKKNKLGTKLSIELNERTFPRGLLVYHTLGTIVNGLSEIGENCTLHGNNCIGTNGKDSNCPIIGKNVTLGFGAKILGGVSIADGVTIGSGAVVVNSIEQEGVTVVGVPAKIK